MTKVTQNKDYQTVLGSIPAVGRMVDYNYVPIRIGSKMKCLLPHPSCKTTIVFGRETDSSFVTNQLRIFCWSMLPGPLGRDASYELL